MASPRRRRAQQPPAPAPRALNLSRDERAAIAALQAAAAGRRPGRAGRALAAARAAARGADARYALAHYQLEIGRARGDQQMQTQAVDALVESGLARADELPALLANQAARAYSRRRRRAGRPAARPDGRAAAEQCRGARRLRPAQGAHRGQRDRAGRTLAVLCGRALAANQAAGGWVSRPRRAGILRGAGARRSTAGWRRRRSRSRAALVGAYPTPVNWRDALLSYRELAPADAALELDVRRLMRASQALAGERDYLEYRPGAATAPACTARPRRCSTRACRAACSSRPSRPSRRRSPPPTARAAADRAGSARLRTAALAAAGPASRRAPPATPISAYGQYAEAAELYRAALQKGGEDPNLVNSRLGAALALAGRRPEAEAALRAVTGPRADLAGFWLAWLARRPGA